MTSFEGSVFTNKYFRLSLGLLLGAALLYLSVRNVSWIEVKSEFESIVYGWIFLALILYWIELTLRIARWRILLSQLKPPVLKYHIVLAFLSGYAANNVLPAKLGEAFRADLQRFLQQSHWNERLLLDWLERYQREQVARLDRAKTKTEPYKTRADDLDGCCKAR